MLILDEHGLLPDGVHDCSMEEIEERFGRFNGKETRVGLFAKLKEYFDELQTWHPDAVMVVDGSFVMGCVDEPEDIDLLIVLPPGCNTNADPRPIEYNLLSKRVLKKRFGFDVFTAPAGSVAENEWLDFFRQVNIKWHQTLGRSLPPTKGILKVVAP